MSKHIIDQLRGGSNSDALFVRRIRNEAASRIEDLEAALGLALCKLVVFEPPDSRAVSDEYVAMAAVHAGDDIVNDEARKLVRDGLAREKMSADETDPVMKHVPENTVQFIDVEYIRNTYGVDTMTAIRVGKSIESGVCVSLEEAVRFQYNRGLAIHIRPQEGETSAEAHDRWALLRAQQGFPFLRHPHLKPGD